LKLDEFESRTGREIGVSRWYPVDQSRIDSFTEITDDPQGVHTSLAGTEQASLGGRIAHEFLILSMLSVMLAEVMPQFEDREISVNYGFDQVRFLNPVHAGSHIRGRFVLGVSDRRANGDRVNRLTATVEIKNVLEPALRAEWLVLERQKKAGGGMRNGKAVPPVCPL
jgi:acyl dehydratase